MHIYYDIEQKTDEWFNLKWGKISGTSSKDLFGAKKIKDLAVFDRIMGEKSSEVIIEEKGFVSLAMENGSILEERARIELQAERGIEFLEAGFIERTLTHGHSPDGISKDKKYGCEIKAPGLKAHNSYCRLNVLPKEYAPQVVNMFACVDTLESLFFCSYNPNYKRMQLFVLEITRDYEIKIGTKTDTIGNHAKHLINRVDELEEGIIDEIEILEERINNKTKF
tara:strand:- start:1730 stop:2401 length:672 start_codon:yes stop_codon:yes gene_type:complete